MRGTSEAVNEAVEAIRTHVAELRKEQKTRKLDPEEFAQLLAGTDRMATVENNRVTALVTALAGKRGLDKLPAYERERLVHALAGIEETKVDPDTDKSDAR